MIPLSQFSITEGNTSAGRVCLAISGEMDVATAPRVTDAVRRARARSEDVLFDLRRVRFIDCAGLRAIVAAHLDSKDDGWGLSIIPAPEVVQRLFALTRTDRFLPFVGPRDALAL